MDGLGSESNLATLKATYQFKLPRAPEGLWIDPMDECGSEAEESDGEEPLDLIFFFQAEDGIRAA